MTKLMQWLFCIGVYLAGWLACVTGSVEVSEAAREMILVSPIYLLISFACYSVAVIGYRVATFGDCEEASVELQQQIKEAKKDLTSKGFKFS